MKKVLFIVSMIVLILLISSCDKEDSFYVDPTNYIICTHDSISMITIKKDSIIIR